MVRRGGGTARIVDRRDTDRLRRGRVYLIHMEALRHNPGDMVLERRCAELALELGRYGDARSYLTDLLDRRRERTLRGRAASELEELLGRCRHGQTRYDDAERSFRRAIEQDPARISCYTSLARLLRVDLRRDEDADAAIRAMVERNPESALAYIDRWRYAGVRTAGRPGRHPEGPGAGPRGPRGAARRRHRQRAGTGSGRGASPLGEGLGLDPGNAALAVGLARLEVREGHLDRAEAVLRRADRVNASVDLAFELAEVLIFQGKIEGDDQAEGYLARLRDAGFGETLVRFLEAEILVQETELGRGDRPDRAGPGRVAALPPARRRGST